MATDDPSHLPPVLRPDSPPVHTLEDLAARFARETRGDLTGVTLTGLTLATADLRPGDVFVAVRGVNRHGAEFAGSRGREGRGRGRDGCRGRRRRGGDGSAGRRRRRPPRRARRALGLGVRHGTRRRPAAAVRHDRHERQDERVAPAGGHPRPARRGHRAVVDRGAAHRRSGHRVAPDDARGVRDARPPRPHARARRRGGRRRGERAGAQPPPRRRTRLRRRRASPT